MLTLRLIGQNDYSIREDGQPIGRIRFTHERTPGIWLWHIQMHAPGLSPLGSARTLDEAKAAFRAAWERFKEQHGT